MSLAQATSQTLSIDAWITTGVLVMILGGLVHGRVGADLVLLSGLVILLLTGVLSTTEAVQGFANPAVVTVGLLYVVAAGLRQTGGMTMVTNRLLGRPGNLSVAQARLTIPVAIGSAFMNNTPIVAMYLPLLAGWAKRNRLSVSRLFMPLSFAAILGGMCTLIGTSTNLVVNELIREEVVRATANGETVDFQPFGMFTLAWVGVPAAILGILYMLLTGRLLLRDRDKSVPLNLDPREYMAPMLVEKGSPIAGKTVEEAGLRQLHGLFLSRLDRHEETIIAVAPEQVIREGDVLVFVGALESIVDLQQIKGLTPMTGSAGQEHTIPRHSAVLFEAVVSNASPLIGRSIREGAFRTTYGAVVIAVHRNGARLRGKIGGIVLRSGDTLLLEAPPEFAKTYKDSKDFYLVSEIPGQAAPRHRLAGIALGVLVAMVVAITFSPSNAMTFAMLAALLMILLRCCTGPQARASVDWQVLTVIGSAFGLGHAMQTSGLAAFIADHMVNWSGQFGLYGLLAVTYVLTAIFTSLITNNAAAVLLFPIAFEAARTHGHDLTPFAVCVAVAASAGFATPLGYQTNLMVMGPGGYRTMDYLRFGGPLTLLVGAVTVIVAPLLA